MVVVRLRVGRLPVHRVVKHGCLWLDLDPGARRGQARAKLHRQVLCVDRQIAGDRRPYRPRRGRQRLVEPQLEAGVGGPDLAAAIEQGALRELEQSLGRRPQIVERVRRRPTAQHHDPHALVGRAIDAGGILAECPRVVAGEQAVDAAPLPRAVPVAVPRASRHGDDGEGEQQAMHVCVLWPGVCAKARYTRTKMRLRCRPPREKLGKCPP